jgi:hypothetical protein
MFSTVVNAAHPTVRHMGKLALYPVGIVAKFIQQG